MGPPWARSIERRCLVCGSGGLGGGYSAPPRLQRQELQMLNPWHAWQLWKQGLRQRVWGQGWLQMLGLGSHHNAIAALPRQESVSWSEMSNTHRPKAPMSSQAPRWPHRRPSPRSCSDCTKCDASGLQPEKTEGELEIKLILAGSMATIFICKQLPPSVLL